jgi:pimeloyl-ACP methyl ester carboxylesterase
VQANEKSAQSNIRGHIILSHGLESGPNASKITRLAGLAEAAGWTTERPDYSDLRDPAARVARLEQRCRATATQPLVLVGSSMGAYISGIVSNRLPVQGLFLLAPPVSLPNAELFELAAERCLLVHGWDDELIPPEAVLGFASVRSLRTLMLPDDHRLSASIDEIAASFSFFLAQLGSA